MRGSRRGTWPCHLVHASLPPVAARPPPAKVLLCLPQQRTVSCLSLVSGLDSDRLLDLESVPDSQPAAALPISGDSMPSQAAPMRRLQVRLLLRGAFKCAHVRSLALTVRGGWCPPLLLLLVPPPCAFNAD
ncbi:hypothetical protein ZWY2020_052962 [Hordeum vulgare]|nr:hypothetical protein ZWY2020_052962 [Hordeum vulgare]